MLTALFLYSLFLQYVFQHNRTGATAVHVDATDMDNCFAISFKTPPSDSTGVPHILEHTALCGSSAYPVRDPFFNMLKRSLNTFMNAMTASDHTMYPFSTQNEKDFAHLLSVYCDAVFHPNLTHLDFLQEGHRIEFENSKDPTSPLTFKGIVFNEMKGSFSDNETLFMTRLKQYILPGTTYENVSGGDPKNIPDLTWEQLRAFHAKHYHPSNALFFSYGDMSPSRHFNYLNTHVLKSFDMNEAARSVQIKSVMGWDAPRVRTITCPADPMATNPDKQVHMAISMLCCKSSDTYECVLLNVMSSLLLNGSAAPLYSALIDTHLAPLLSGGSGYDNSTVDTTFSVGVQGISESDIPKVEAVIWETLSKVAENGFPQKQIDAILHQYEMSIKASKTNVGLGFLYSISSTWVGGGDLVHAAQLQRLMDQLRKDLSPGSTVLQGKIKQYLLNNPHTLTLRMLPNPTFHEEALREERSKLDHIAATLDESSRDNILTSAVELEKEQQKVQDCSVLPTISLSDVSLKPTRVHITTSSSNRGVPIQWVHEPTKGLVYLRMKFNLDHLPPRLRPYLPLFTATVAKVGARDLDYKEQQLELNLATGGVGAAVHGLSFYDQEMDDANSHLPCGSQRLVLSTSCLERNFDRTLRLFHDVLTTPRFDDIGQLQRRIASTASRMSSGIADSGNSYAAYWAGASLSSVRTDMEIRGGFSQVQFMQKLAAAGEAGALEASAALKEILALVVHTDASSSDAAVSIVASPSMHTNLTSSLDGFLTDLPASSTVSPSGSISAGDWPAVANNRNTFVALPLSVNFCARVIPTVPELHKDEPSLDVLSNILSSCYLHREIREKGGAYGGSAGSSSGRFVMSSYYDPNTLNTIKAFDAASEWAASGKFTDEDITQAKLSAFSSLDAPKRVSSKGMGKFLYGVTEDIILKRRHALFNVSRSDVIRVSEKYLVNNAGGKPADAIFGSVTNEEMDNVDGWTRREFTT
jgi:Zn-dependent M16 (insulinase) family peptidase